MISDPRRSAGRSTTVIRDFAYHRPRTVDEAAIMATELGESAVFLAGGTELLPDMKRGRESAQHLITLRDIPDLAAIRSEDGALHVGAMARLEDIARSPEVESTFPLLAAAAAMIGGPQIRHQGTIGGNFCRAVPCADLPPACLVGGANLRLARNGKEWMVPAEAFFTGPRQTVLRHGDMLVAVVIPVQPKGAGSSYQRFALRAGSALAVASVAARLVVEDDTIRDARIALGAVAPIPLLATEAAAELMGNRVSNALLATAARVAATEAMPISDIRGSAEYRRELVEVLTRRALAAALERAPKSNRGHQP